jgi:hypothetical protein
MHENYILKNVIAKNCKKKNNNNNAEFYLNFNIKKIFFELKISKKYL